MNNLEANNNLYAGLDVGSRTTKLVVYNGAVCETQIIPTGVTPLERCRELLNAGFSNASLSPVMAAIWLPLYSGRSYHRDQGFCGRGAVSGTGMPYRHRCWRAG